MKILLVGPLKKVGGLSKYISDIVSTEEENTIYHFNIARPLKKKIKSADRGYKGVFNTGILRSLQGILITLWHLIFFPLVLLKENPKVVHLAVTGGFVFWEDAIYIYISKIFGKKIFLHYLGSFDLFYGGSGKTEKKLIRFFLKACDSIAVLSIKVKSLVESIVLDTPKVYFLPSSIDFRQFNNDELLFPADDNQKVLFLGGFDAYKKGIIDILKVIPEIIDINPNIIFILCSSKKLDLDIDVSLKRNIKYIDWVKEEDKIPLYNSSDIFLLPSYDEGLPYTMMEAMASGLPIISTNVGGIPEVVKHGKNGFLLTPGDVDKMKEYILLLTENKELRLKIGKANKNLIKNNYSLDTILKKIKNIYNIIINNETTNSTA